MSGHELNRVEVMGRVKNGDLKLSDAAVMLNVSYRQAKRLWRRYRKLGSEGLKHGNVGRPSNRRKPLKVLQRTAFWPEFSSWQPRTRSCIRWHRQKFGRRQVRTDQQRCLRCSLLEDVAQRGLLQSCSEKGLHSLPNYVGWVRYLLLKW